MSNAIAVADRPREIAVVDVPLGAGALDQGCREGPAAFRRSGEPARLAAAGVALDWCETPGLPTGSEDSAVGAIARTVEGLADSVEGMAAAGEPFVVLGGDHSCAVGTWSGAARALRHRGPLGLVWIDAHLDLHRPETTHSGAVNGMPVACLLGHGFPRLTRLARGRPALDPRHLCLVGVRSGEPEEAAFADRLGVRVIGMEEVRRRGLSAALDEALAIAMDGTAGFGVSLDLDALDPADAPGVGTPEPGGIGGTDLIGAWRGLVASRDCLGIEIAEFNPFRDEGGRTARLAGALIETAFSPETPR